MKIRSAAFYVLSFCSLDQVPDEVKAMKLKAEENPATEIAHPQLIIKHTGTLSNTTSNDSFFAQFDKNNRELETTE